MKEGLYKRYMLGVLLVITAHNYVDRTALGLLLQSIKLDLHLTDTQLGLLTGIAFALFYSLMGIPIARWADRGNRIVVITLATVLWSAAVALCGTARSFVQLLLIRVGVAVGEAGCLPPSHSLIAERFTRAERPRAVAIYMLSGPLGLLVGYLTGGWLNELYGWRMTYMLIGLPGLVLAGVAWFTLREPRHVRSSNSPEPGIVANSPSAAGAIPAAQPDLRRACAILWSNRTFRHLLLCLSVTGFFAYGGLHWLPAFFIRVYGLTTGEVGTWFAAIYGLGGLLGTYWGGALASRYAVENESLQLKAAALAFVLFTFLSAGVYLSRHVYLALGSLALAMIGGCVTNAPLYATIQTVVPDRMRATAIGLVYLLANLIGMGLGPLAVGVLSDAFRPWAGAESLRYALIVLCPGYFWAAWHVWQASKTVKQDLMRLPDNGAELARLEPPSDQRIKSSSGSALAETSTK